MSSDSDSDSSEGSFNQGYFTNNLVNSDSPSEMQSEEDSPGQAGIFVPSGKFGEKIFELLKKQGINIEHSQSFPQDLFRRIISEDIINFNYLSDYFDLLQDDLEGRGFYALALKELEEYVEESEGVLCFEYYQFVLPLLIRLLSEYPETQEVLNFHVKEAFCKHMNLYVKLGGLSRSQFI